MKLQAFFFVTVVCWTLAEMSGFVRATATAADKDQREDISKIAEELAKVPQLGVYVIQRNAEYRKKSELEMLRAAIYGMMVKDPADAEALGILVICADEEALSKIAKHKEEDTAALEAAAKAAYAARHLEEIQRSFNITKSGEWRCECKQGAGTTGCPNFGAELGAKEIMSGNIAGHNPSLDLIGDTPPKLGKACNASESLQNMDKILGLSESWEAVKKLKTIAEGKKDDFVLPTRADLNKGGKCEKVACSMLRKAANGNTTFDCDNATKQLFGNETADLNERFWSKFSTVTIDMEALYKSDESNLTQNTDPLDLYIALRYYGKKKAMTLVKMIKDLQAQNAHGISPVSGALSTILLFALF